MALASLAAAALATGVVSTTASAAEPPVRRERRDQARPKAQEKKDKLGSHDRSLLAKARAEGDERVTVMLATTTGAGTDVRRRRGARRPVASPPP